MNAPFSAEKLFAFRDLDAERAEARLRSSQRAVATAQQAALSVCPLGLDAKTLQHLQDLVVATRCQPVSLTLLGADQVHAADVLLLNGADPAVAAWWPGQSHWLARRGVLWLGKALSGAPHRRLKLPMAWKELPQALLKAYQAVPPPPRALVARRVQPDSPALLVMAGSRTVRQQSRDWLEQLGFHATVTSQAREGLAALHAAQHSAVLLCEQVPDVDALGLVRRFRSMQHRLGAPPLIYVSRDDGALQRVRARLIGFDQVGAWPDSPEGLKRLLEQLPAPRT
jgi:CheY-like chemotaxis protein